jgi:penicillin amidase
MKVLKRLFFALLVFIVLLFLVLLFYLDHQKPKYEGKVIMDQLNDSVEVLFDMYGIPHIYAQNETDAYFALGYLQAQERLFQMVLYRRLVQARASEIFGADLLKTDIYFKTLGLYDLSEEAAKAHFDTNYPKPWHKPSMAYLDGINAFIDEGVLPFEFRLVGFEPEHFKPADIYASINLTALGFSFAQKDDMILNYIFENLGEHYLDVFSKDLHKTADSSVAIEQLMSQKLETSMDFLALPLWEGSNAWVLAPKKTQSGKAMLANDTHIGFSQPAVWFEAYLNYPGYEFYGNFLPSVPFGVLGYNRNLAWGLTIFPFDNMDYYQLSAKDADNSYLYFKDTINFEFKEFEIKVKGTESHKMKVKYSEFGPVINHIDPFIDSLYNKDIALCWSVYHLDQTALHALYKINHAQNLSEFEKALPLIDIVGLNVMYADANNNIAWWGCGKIPLRDSLSESFKFLSSSNGVDKQMGFMNFHNNPQLVNPECGYIVSANNNPVLSGAAFVRGNYLPDDRFNTITKSIIAHDKWNTENCQNLQLNHQSEVKRDMAHFIMTQMIDLPEEGNYRTAADELIRWNGNYGLKDIAPCIFERMYYHIAQQAYADELGDDLFEKALGTYLLKKSLPELIMSKKSPWWQKYRSNKPSDRTKILNLSFMTAVDELTREMGADVSKWEWGKINTLTHRHAMGKVKPLDRIYNVGPYAVAGGNQLVNKMGSSISGKPVHQVLSGPAVRIIIDFAHVDSAVNIIPTGQSGNFRSPYYKDQAEMFVNGEYRGMIMDKSILLNDSNCKKLIFATESN